MGGDHPLDAALVHCDDILFAESLLFRVEIVVENVRPGADVAGEVLRKRPSVVDPDDDVVPVDPRAHALP